MSLKELKNSEEYEKITFELKEKILESFKKDNHLSDYPTLRETVYKVLTYYKELVSSVEDLIMTYNNPSYSYAKNQSASVSY